MGRSGPLKLVSGLRSVSDATEGTAAAELSAARPLKPQSVCDDETLSAMWDEVVEPLDKAGLISAVDGPALELCLRHFQCARSASVELMGSTNTLRDKKNDRDMKNPSEVIFRSQSEMFLKYAQQLGMTFVSRARTPAAKKDDADDNPFAPGAAAQ